MLAMSKHAAPSLRLAQVPDAVTVLASAMRAFADRPGSADARRGLDAAMRGCTDEEYEAAWDLAQREEAPAAPPVPAAEPAPARPAALTRGQLWLAGVAVALELALAPVFFAVMFVTVNGMLAASFRWWAWAVPVSTEITFILLLVLAVLFEWMRRPVPVLWKLPYLFMGLSSFMNVWAGRGSVADLAGHLAVTAAFFIPLAFAKTTVRKLIVTPAERARAQSLADARAHAYDVLRAAFGVLWRYRTPALLRRQLRSGRLPAAVMAAVGTCDAGTWEPVVQAWITAAVTLPGQVGKALRAASAAVAVTSGEEAIGTPSETAAEPLPEAGPEPLAQEPVDTSESLAEVSARSSRTPGPRSPGKGSRRLHGVPVRPSGGVREEGSGRTPVIPSKASDEALAALLLPKLAAGEEVSQTRTVKIVREAAGGSTGIGPERAARVLALARRINSGEVAQTESA